MSGGFREIDDHAFDYDPMTGVRQRLKIDSDGVFHFVLYDLIKRGIWSDPDRRKRWWNSIEAAPYRTRDFKV